MFKKLRNRFLRYTMGLLSLVFVVLFVFIYFSAEYNARQQIDMSLQKAIEKSEHRKTDNPLLAAAISVKLDDDTDEVENVSSLAEVEEDSLEAVTSEILNRGEKKGFVSMNGSRYAYLYIPGPGHNNVALVSSAQYDQTMSSMLLSYLIAGTGTLLLLFGLSYLFSEKAIKPVRVAFEKQKQFVADASHELKTPLTIIGTNLELIETNSGETVASQHRWLSYIGDQTVRMSHLVNDLLKLAQLDDPAHALTLSQTDISAFLKRTLLYYEVPFYEKGINVSSDIAENVYADADGPALERLIGILLDNALKYTSKSGKVRVSLSQDKTKIHLCVANTHEALKQEHVDKFFDRFYRVSSSRSQQTPGYGLGLSIAKSITEQHGGKISAQLKDDWIEFNVDLPVK